MANQNNSRYYGQSQSLGKTRGQLLSTARLHEVVTGSKHLNQLPSLGLTEFDYGS
jgi:hypothetical protein